MKQLNRFIKVNFACDNCSQKFRQETAYSPDSSLKETYCVSCVEIEEKKPQSKPKKT